MLRLSAIFIVLCTALIAASAAAVLYLLVGLNGSESLIVGVAVMTGLAVYNAVTTRVRDRTDFGTQIADLSRGTADLARQVAELNRRTASLEGQGARIIEGANEKARSATEAVSAELGELGNLVKQLAETVALHDLKFAGAKDYGSHDSAAARMAMADEPDAGVMVSRTEPTGPDAERAAMIETVRGAIENRRVDLYMQPIVTLPQRKVRYYETFTRLRTEDGAVLAPAEFLQAAETGGMMPKIDQLLLHRSVQVVRRLQLKNRDIGLFCNISASTLNDEQTFPEILLFMEANRALAGSLVLEFQHSLLRSTGPLETEALAALRDLGFRFCIDRVSDLRMDPRDLGERGIRYVKVPASFLLGDNASAGSDIHAADLSDLLGRFGISLIAERIDAEAQVVDLLEYDVRFGQGFLFSQPRPVRADALRGSGDGTPDDEGDGLRKVASGRSGVVL